MILQSMPYPASLFLSSALGAVIYADGTDAVAASSAIATYDQTAFDPLGWEALADNATLVVPDHPDVQLIRMHASSYWNAINTFGIYKWNGSGYAAFDGMGRSRGMSGGNNSNCCSTPILPAVAGDRFRAYNESAASATLQETGPGRNWFGAEVLPPGTRYCFVQKSSSQSVSSGSLTNVTWQTEVVDTLGCFNAGSSQTDFVVPADTTGKIRVTTQLSHTPAASLRLEAGVYLNDNEICYSNCSDSGANTKSIQVHSRIIDVVPGDVIRIKGLIAAASQSLISGQAVWACIEELPSDARYCIATKSAQQNTTNALIQWDGVDMHDPEGLHDPASGNTTINFPPDASEYRVTFSIQTNSSGDEAIIFLSPGSARPGGPCYESTTATAEKGAVMGNWCPVGALTGVEVGFTSGGGSKGIVAPSYFQIEFR